MRESAAERGGADDQSPSFPRKPRLHRHVGQDGSRCNHALELILAAASFRSDSIVYLAAASGLPPVWGLPSEFPDFVSQAGPSYPDRQAGRIKRDVLRCLTVTRHLVGFVMPQQSDPWWPPPSPASYRH